MLHVTVLPVRGALPRPGGPDSGPLPLALAVAVAVAAPGLRVLVPTSVRGTPASAPRSTGSPRSRDYPPRPGGPKSNKKPLATTVQFDPLALVFLVGDWGPPQAPLKLELELEMGTSTTASVVP